MSEKKFNIKSDNPWDSILIPDGQELAVGARVYNGARMMLVGGVETEVAEQIYGGDYALDNGKYITVVDGIITEISDIPTPSKSIGMKEAAVEREKKYRK